eukprot:1154129-Rhodomonas_salina.1
MEHKAHIKEAMFATNWQDWEIQIMSVHVRKQAIFHHTQRMSEELDMMDELCYAWDAWTLLQEDKLPGVRRKIAVDARLGSSLGI